MTAVLEQVPVDRISGRAREVRFSRLLVTVIAGVLFAAGWLACKAFAVAWFAAAWSAVAVAEGWAEARRSQVKRGPAGPG